MEKGDSSKDLGSRELKAGGSYSLFRTYEGRMSLVSMVLLVFQGTALSLVLRYSRYDVRLALLVKRWGPDHCVRRCCLLCLSDGSHRRL